MTSRQIQYAFLLVSSWPLEVGIHNSHHLSCQLLLLYNIKSFHFCSFFKLNHYQKLRTLRETALDAVIQSAASGDKLDFKGLSELATLENRSRQATRAIERLVERLLPMALWARLREESHAASARARALEEIAQERAERVLDQMREAVGEEMVLPVDLSKGVSGALLARAADLKYRAVQLSANADAIEKQLGR